MKLSDELSEPPQRQAFGRSSQTLVKATALGVTLIAVGAAAVLLWPTGPTVKEALDTCGLTHSEYIGVDREDTRVVLSTSNLTGTLPGVDIREDLGCMKRELGAPRELSQRMMDTRAEDGLRHHRWDGFMASWRHLADGTFVFEFDER